MPDETLKPLVIRLSKFKCVLALLASAACVGAGFYLWQISESQHRYPTIYVQGWAILAMVVSGLCMVGGIFKTFDKKPGLVLDAEGFIDNSALGSAGRVPWSDVSGLKIATRQNRRFLVIEIREPQKYLEKANFLKRPLRRLGMKIYGTPITVGSGTLKIDFDDLVARFRSYYEEYGSVGQ